MTKSEFEEYINSFSEDDLTEETVLEICKKHNLSLTGNTLEFISKEISVIYSEDYQAIRRRVNRYFEEAKKNGDK